MKIFDAKQNIKQIWIYGWYCFSCFTIVILTLKCKYYKFVFHVYNVFYNAIFKTMDLSVVYKSRQT